MPKLATIRKAAAAAVYLVGTWGVTAAVDGSITAVELFGLLVVIGGARTVWALPNEPEA